MRHVLLLFVLATSGASLVVPVTACGGGDNVDVRENERILETLPEMPGAERIRVTSAPYHAGDGDYSPIAGYTTNVVYAAPAGATMQDVIDFYVGEMSNEWRHELGDVPVVEAGTGRQLDTVLLVSFTRGEAAVHVNTDGMIEGADPPAFEVAIDHLGGREES